MKSALDVLAEELGAVAGQIERESRLRIDAEIAELRRLEAERELRLSNLERLVQDRLATVRDGHDGEPGKDGRDGEDGKPGERGEKGERGLDGAPGERGQDGSDGKDGRDGRDVEDITAAIIDGETFELGFVVGETRTVFELEMPRGAPGKDGADGERGEKGDVGPAGSLPSVEAWSAGVHYAGDVRSHSGGTWQAKRDTAAEPPSDDWTCISAPGANGKDGQSFNPRGLWAAEEIYRRLDVVALNGGSFVALKDEPGPCPGEGWKLLASQGKTGQRGEKGERGERGLPGPPVASMSVDETGMLTLSNADGSQVHCDLYPLLSKISR